MTLPFALPLPFPPLGCSSLWTIIHPEDKAEVMRVLIMVTHAPEGRVQCRIKSSFPDAYLPSDISMRSGLQGIVCVIRVSPTYNS